MAGVNSILLNQATMCEAIQYWLNARLSGLASDKPDVTFVKPHGTDSFEVTLTSPEDKP
jgi:hypothetical protein